MLNKITATTVVFLVVLSTSCDTSISHEPVAVIEVRLTADSVARVQDLVTVLGETEGLIVEKKEGTELELITSGRPGFFIFLYHTSPRQFVVSADAGTKSGYLILRFYESQLYSPQQVQQMANRLVGQLEKVPGVEIETVND